MISSKIIVKSISLLLFCLIIFINGINADLAILRISKDLSTKDLKLCAIKKNVRKTDYNQEYNLFNLQPLDGCDVNSINTLAYSAAFITIEPPYNCTLAEILRNFAQKNASLALIGTNGPIKTNLTNSSVTISPVFIPLDYAYKITSFLQNSKNPKVNLQMSQEKFDFSAIIIWFIAVIVVLLGSLWSSFEFKQTLKESQQQSTNILSVTNPDFDSNRVNQENHSNVNETTQETLKLSKDKQNNQQSALLLSISYIGILVLLIFVIAMLLLLYFFYDVMIYFIYVIFTIGATTSMYRIACIPLDYFKIATCEVPESFITRKLKWRPQIVKIFVFLICLTISIIWFVYRHHDWIWIIQNLMAISLALNALSFYRLSSYKTVTIILIVFFIYDVFMVFISPFITNGTSIMEAVAFGGKENSDRQPSDIIQFGEKEITDRLPVVIIIPRLSNLAQLCSQFIDYPFSLLGLGDLLIPGLSINYGILFDLAIGNKHRRVYFIANIIAYGVGLFCAFIALVFMNTAQPALLYLCPSHLLFTYGLALFRKEVPLLWSGKPITDYTSLDSISNVEDQ